jgi:ribosome biogenesis GTPase
VIVIDTPGMREFALVGGDEADLGAFSDITELAENCQFRDCSHGDEPGCAVAEAVRNGGIDADRLSSFRLLADELKQADQARQRRKPDRGKRRFPSSKRRRNDWDDGK